ncbi:MAG: hypothetical protein ACW99G_20625, partial [Candidatus Thorarchaeota archaeon]
NTNTNSYDIENWKIGKESGGAWWGTIYFDDIYIDDATGEPEPSAAPPPLRFYLMTPDGNGTHADWTGSDADKTDNYQLVDEVPANTGDYVEATVSGLYDSYAMSNVVLAGWQDPKAIILYSHGERQSTTESYGLGVRYSSNEVITSGLDFPTGAFADVYTRFETKPGGGDWDQASISGYELVSRSDGAF